MTIGPEPRTRILWMSSLRGNYIDEAVEEVHGIVRTRARLRVVLRRGARNVFQDKPLHCPVVEIHVAELGSTEIRLPPDRLIHFDSLLATGPDHGETVVLARDVD